AKCSVRLRLAFFCGLQARRLRYSIPRRYPMPPPNLAADAPILNVFEPLRVNLFPVRREKTDEMIAHHGERFFCFWIAQKPLLADTQLNRQIATISKADIFFVRLGL